MCEIVLFSPSWHLWLGTTADRRPIVNDGDPARIFWISRFAILTGYGDREQKKQEARRHATLVAQDFENAQNH
jgi:hypothetical protein